MKHIIKCKIGAFSYYLKVQWKGGKPSCRYEGLRDNASKMDHNEAKTALLMLEKKSKFHLEIISC